jgi:hypothetical protein
VPQAELDPQQPIVPLGEKSILSLPGHVRRFGYVPDLSACMPGDLVLFRSHQPNVTSRSIAAAQSAGGINPEHSRWTHAAIFLSDDFVVEASPITGVTQRTLYADIPDKILRIRRQPALTEIERYRIALRALRMLGARYSFGGAILTGWYLLNGLWTSPSVNSLGPAVLCSKVFSDAYSDVTRKLLSGCPIDFPVTPAHLSATPDLEDIEVGWLKLV